jgi:aryl-alcohol dehydrogenase-like predicted oxidoreductase
MDFLEPFGSQNEDISNWMTSHGARIEEAFEAVASIYAEKAARRVDRIRRAVAAADPAWAAEGTLSQKAVRAVRSTPGVSCVLVGMRREAYVADVLAELRLPVKQDGQLASWRKLTAELAHIAV